MSESMKLSQDEIDALLNHNSDAAAEPQAAELLTSVEADTLGEIGNISFGSAATSLSTLLQHRVDITTPTVSVIEASEVQKRFPTPYVLVAVDFTDGLMGSNALAIEVNDAKTIADLMMGGDGTNIEGELNELHLSAVGEAMNQMMGGAATSMSQMFGRYINISPPHVDVIDFATSGQHAFIEGDHIVNVEFHLRVGTLINSRIMQLLPLGFARDMVNTLQMGPVPSREPKSEPAQVASASAVQSSAPSLSTTQASPLVATMANVPTDTVQAMSQMAPAREAKDVIPSVQFQRPEFANFDEELTPNVTSRNLSLLYDVPLNVTVELGRAKKVIREILELSPGSILELDKLAGEPVDIFVNNKRIAIGEVVVIDENFGVRVTDIINTEQRVSQLT